MRLGSQNSLTRPIRFNIFLIHYGAANEECYSMYMCMQTIVAPDENICSIVHPYCKWHHGVHNLPVIDGAHLLPFIEHSYIRFFNDFDIPIRDRLLLTLRYLYLPLVLTSG